MSESLNKDYINQSLANQIAEMTMKVAERDAAITELVQKKNELTKELEGYRKKEINEMDGAE